MKEKMDHVTAGKVLYAGWAREAALIQAVKPTVLTFNFEFRRSVIFRTIFIQFDDKNMLELPNERNAMFHGTNEALFD